MTKALGLAAVSKRPWDILLSLPDNRTARSASKSVPRARPDAKKKPHDNVELWDGHRETMTI
jgi:hypothetical protein